MRCATSAQPSTPQTRPPTTPNGSAQDRVTVTATVDAQTTNTPVIKRSKASARRQSGKSGGRLIKRFSGIYRAPSLAEPKFSRQRGPAPTVSLAKPGWPPLSAATPGSAQTECLQNPQKYRLRSQAINRLWRDCNHVAAIPHATSPMSIESLARQYQISRTPKNTAVNNQRIAGIQSSCQ
jgi:hypothetical protein